MDYENWVVYESRIIKVEELPDTEIQALVYCKEGEDHFTIKAFLVYRNTIPLLSVSTDQQLAITLENAKRASQILSTMVEGIREKLAIPRLLSEWKFTISTVEAIGIDNVKPNTSHFSMN